MRTHPDMILDSPSDGHKFAELMGLEPVKTKLATCCPHCSQPMTSLPESAVVIDDTLYYKAFVAVLSPSEAALACALAESFGRIVKLDRLMESIYPRDVDRPDDGHMLSIWVFKLRRKLENYIPDLEIINHPWVGYTLRERPQG